MLGAVDLSRSATDRILGEPTDWNAVCTEGRNTSSRRRTADPGEGAAERRNHLTDAFECQGHSANQPDTRTGEALIAARTQRIPPPPTKAAVAIPVHCIDSENPIIGVR